MSIVPSPWTIVHIARTYDTVRDDHGNLKVLKLDPVVRKAMSIVQKGIFGTSKQIMNTESVKRVETLLEMAVADPETYAVQDQVLIFPELDSDGDYVTGTGTAYFVEGVPSDDRVGPWRGLLAVFGGVVHLRRIT